MGILHIFNPEHDIALAADLANFTAPHAGRQLRADLGFLPALWSKENDFVLVDNVEYAEKSWRRLCHRMNSLLNLSVSAVETPSFRRGNTLFLPWKQLGTINKDFEVHPWGWDKALKASLIRNRMPVSMLASEEQLASIREMSHRHFAASLLPKLQTDRTVGESFECTEENEVEALLQKYQQVVMKAPWSSSGRGLRFLDVNRTPFEMQSGWFHNVVAKQGSVMVEPLYNKVKDFGMEFSSDGTGNIQYEGLSLFHTLNGAYIGNILATDKKKQEMISRYLPIDLIEDVKQKVIDNLIIGNYKGPFGVDMMVVAGKDKFMLHPCVEINLRRTMGHVALSMTPDDDEIVRVMRIELTDHYKLKINKL